MLCMYGALLLCVDAPVSVLKPVLRGDVGAPIVLCVWIVTGACAAGSCPACHALRVPLPDASASAVPASCSLSLVQVSLPRAAVACHVSPACLVVCLTIVSCL